MNTKLLTDEERAVPKQCGFCDIMKTVGDFRETGTTQCKICHLAYCKEYQKSPAGRQYAVNRFGERRAREAGAIANIGIQEFRDMVDNCRGICCYCGSRDKPLHADHCVPISRGGNHTLANVTMACQECNSSKGDRTPQEFAEFLLTKRPKTGRKNNLSDARRRDLADRMRALQVKWKAAKARNYTLAN